MTLKAGDTVEVTITHLEMDQRPAHPIPRMPAGAPSILVAAEHPPVWYFLQLYGAVGADYEWTDQYRRSAEELSGFLAHPRVRLCTLIRGGWPHGFFVLDGREDGICEIAYFGLVAEAMGQGLGEFLLCTAVHMAWDQPGTTRVIVNTNTLDHPRALPLYQKVGFRAERREIVTRTLNRDRH